MPNAGVIIGTPTAGATPPPGYGFLRVVNGNNPIVAGGTATVGGSTKNILAVFALAPSTSYSVSFVAPPNYIAPPPASPVPVSKGLTTTVTVIWGS